MLLGFGTATNFENRIRGLFSAGEVGVHYDPSDFSTMFQDSAGTTAAAIEQPVGLILDKSKGLVLGPELVDAQSAATWVRAGTNLVEQDGDEVKITFVDNSVGASLVFTDAAALNADLVVGRSYKLEFDSRVNSGSNVSIYVWTGTVNGGQTVQTSVTKTRSSFVFVAGSTTLAKLAMALMAAGEIAWVSNVTLKELPGNHATQATSTARPVLRAGLDHDGVDDKHAQSAGGGSTTAFFLCAGIKPEGGAGAVRVLWSDAGTNTGYIVRLNASNQLELAAGNGTAYTTIATVATLSVGTAYVVTVWDDGTNLNVQVNSGAVASVARPVVAAGTATASIGSDNGAATGWFNGLIYSLIQVKDDAGTDAERASAKAYVASKAGVTL